MAQEIKMSKEMIIVVETDAKGNILFANADFCQIALFTNKELFWKPHNIIRH